MLPSSPAESRHAELPGECAPAQAVVRAAGGLCLLVGAAVLASYAFAVDALALIARDWERMKVNSAIGLLLLGTILVLPGRKRFKVRSRITIWALAGLAVVLPFATLLEYLLGIDLGIDQWLMADSSPRVLYPGRMAPQSAVAFLLLATGLSFALLPGRRAAAASQVLTLCALSIAVVALLSHLLGLVDSREQSFNRVMTIGTTLGLAAAALGAFLVRPREGLAAIVTHPATSGNVVRLMLGAVWVATPLIAFLRLDGQNRGWYGTESGLAFFALSQLVLLTTIILVAGHILARVDEKRRTAERGQQRLLQDLLASNSRLEQAVQERTAELTASKERTEFILDNSPALIGYIDPELRLRFCSATYRVWFGIDPAAMVGRAMRDVLGPVEFAKLETHYQEALAGRGSSYERRIDGPTPRDILVQLVPDIAPDGRLKGIFVGGSDITARRTAEAARERSEALLRTVTRTGTACIGYLDTRLHFQFCNPTYRDWYGLAPEALLGRSVREVVGDEDYGSVVSHYEAALSGHRASYERRIVRDGHARDVLVSLDPDLGAGRVIGVCIHSVDISDRVRSEQALRSSEERFQLVASGTLDGIWDWDIVKGECYYSPRYPELLGYRHDEIDRSWAFFEAHLHPEDRERTSAALRAHFEQREPYDVEYRLRTRSGDYHWFHARGQATWNRDDQAIRFTGALRDISARRRIEEELHRSSELLQRTELTARIGGWELDLATMTPAWSEGTYRIHGLEPGTSPDLVAAIGYFVPEARPVLEQAVHDAIEHGTAWDLEMPFVTATGKPLWVRTQADAVQVLGKTVKLHGTIQDITEHKRITTELAANRKLLAELIDAIPVPLIVKDESHRYVIVNQAMADLHGATATGLRGRTDADFHSPEAVRQYLEEDERVLRTGQPLIMEQAFSALHERRYWVMKHKRRITLPDGKQWIISALLDLTDRKQAELALKRNQAFLAGVLDAIPQPVFVKDAEHRWVLVNAAFCQLIERERADLLGRTDPDILPADMAKRAWAEDDAVMDSNRTLVVEEENSARVRSGRRWLLKTKCRVDLPDGSYLVGMSVDITGLKQVQAALQQSERQLLLLAEYSSDLIFQITPEGLVEYASPASLALLGIAPEDMTGRPVCDLVHPADLPGVRADFLKMVNNGGTARIATCRLRGHDGDWSWIETSFRAVQGGRSDPNSHIIGVARDVDQRVRQAVVLDRFKHVLDNTRDLIFMVDVDTLRITYANQGAVDALGYERERLLQMGPWDLRDDITEAQYRIGVEPLLREDIKHRQFAVSLRRADGTSFPADATMQLVERPGEAGIFISVIRDATERMRIERMKTEFVSTVSHELRTPLTSIRGSLGLIAGGAVGAIPAKVAELVRIAYENSDRLMRLINDILDIEKIESGRMRFDPKVHNLVSLLARSIEMNRAYGEQLGVRFELHGPIPAVRVLGDECMQILTNLLSNAAKFSPREGVVEISATCVSGMARIAVRDHGPGIPDSFRNEIFGKFRQADSSDSRLKGGTGLGLSIAKALVENHGGEIGFGSIAGSGTTFHFTLRIEPEREPESESEAQAAAAV